MMARVPLTTGQVVSSRVIVNVENIVLTPEQFFRLCRDNPELRLELTAQKELIIMSPTGSRTGSQNMELSFQIQRWTIQDGGGIAFDSSTGFLLPNGATRSPDASWIRRTRWDALAAEDQQRFAPICPDFVVELRSPSDAIDDLETKMMGVHRQRSTTRLADRLRPAPGRRLSSQRRARALRQSSIDQRRSRVAGIHPGSY